MREHKAIKYGDMQLSHIYCKYNVQILIRFGLVWFIIAQIFFFSDKNYAYTCSKSNIIFIDWKSLYFVVLFWIAEIYCILALYITFILYVIADMKMHPHKLEFTQHLSQL